MATPWRREATLLVGIDEKKVLLGLTIKIKAIHFFSDPTPHDMEAMKCLAVDLKTIHFYSGRILYGRG